MNTVLNFNMEINNSELDYDAKLAENVRNEDEKSLRELIDRHTPLCFKIYKEYSDCLYASGVAIEDLKGEKDYIMWQAALSHDPTRGKYTTLLGSRIRFQCLGAMNKKKKKYIFKDERDLEILLNREESYSLPEDESFKDYIIYILDQLEDKRVKSVFEMRFFNNEKMTLEEIGKELNVSKQTSANLLERGLDILRAKLSSENVYDQI